MTEIKVVVVNGKEKAEVEFAAAEEVADFTPTPWGDSLDEAPKTTTEQDEYKRSFDDAVNFLANCDGEDFLELVKYAKKHNNTFFHCVKEVSDVINADDAYCSALILLARPLGSTVERKAFELFELATVDKNVVEDFTDFWKALQTISYFCG